MKFNDNGSSEYKDKIYIIGSISCADKIKSWADYYTSTGRYRVRYVKPEKNKSLSDCMRNCLLNIIWSDRVYIVPKPDGTLGESVTYEKVFATLIGKRVEIMQLL